jgi:hypothetical protein
MAITDDFEFTAKEVAAHRDAADAWMVIHGEGIYSLRGSYLVIRY